MYIIIGGGGDVGYYLTKSLLGQGHEVLLLEKGITRYQALSEELGQSVVRGDACEARTMEEVGANRADVVIAVTGEDEDNLVICQMAKKRFNVARTIARLNNPKNELIFQKLGMDLSAAMVKTRSVVHWVQHASYFSSSSPAGEEDCSLLVGTGRKRSMCSKGIEVPLT